MINRTEASASWNPGFTAAQYEAFAEELERDLGQIASLVMVNTMTSMERLYALRKVCEYVSAFPMDGIFVECGVWRGGSTILAAATFRQNAAFRPIEAFDTFAGMTEPGLQDIDWTGRTAASRLNHDPLRLSNVWAMASRQIFESNFAKVGYPSGLLTIYEGDVRETITSWDPKPIAILRLDTDWYETTKLELCTFWQHIVPGGFVIVDDYGYWQGARQATDEFMATLPTVPLALRVDHSGLLLMKPPVRR